MGMDNTLKKQTVFKIPQGATHLVVEEHIEWEEIPECIEMSFVDDSYVEGDEIKEGTFNYDDTTKMFFSKKD